MPAFGQLRFLKCPLLKYLYKVEYMEGCFHEIVPSPDNLFFPSLQELTLESMNSIKGWWQDMEGLISNINQTESLVWLHTILHLSSRPFLNS